MPRILYVTSGRADATPLGPVVRALDEAGFETVRCDAEDLSVDEAVFEADNDIAFVYKPDMVLLLGDRYESLAAALSATVRRVPIAHIHGGEASFGSFDNQIRDAISKLAHIHFVAAHAFKMRLVEDLGEDADRVHVVGAPGLDNLAHMPPRVKGNYFVCTYHPATLGDNDLPDILAALERFPDYKTIWTGVNNDPGNDRIRTALSGADVRDLSPRGYVDLCRGAALVIGNSSSGIIEAPTMEVPSVNIGSRQDGRLRGPSVFSCHPGAIAETIKAALQYEGTFTNPYGGPGASKKIADILKTAEIRMQKRW